MKSREEIEELLNNCYTLKRIKRVLKSMLICSDISQIQALDCKNKCEKGKVCIDCLMDKFLDVDLHLQKIDLKSD